MSEENTTPEGGNQPAPAQDTTQTPDIDSVVNTATASLRANRDKILNEKREISEKAKALEERFNQLGGDEGIANLMKVQEQIESSELMKMIAEGRHDEWYEAKTESLRASHSNEKAALEERYQEAAERAQAAETRFQNTVLENSTLGVCAKAGVIDGALPDVVARVSREFTWSEELQAHVILDDHGGIVLGKDGKSPKNVAEWLEERQTDARHWFPPSKGGGLSGGGLSSGRPVARSDELNRVGNMSLDDYKAWREQNPKFQNDQKRVY